MKQALILIDIQNFYFFDGPSRLYEPERAGEQAAKVLDYFRKSGQPVIFIQHLYNGGGYTQPMEEVIAINKIVEPHHGEPVIQKRYPNSFRETTLKQTLDELQVNNLVMIGNMSHMCVDTSVRAAADMGYQVTVLEDACTTKDLNFKDTTIPATMVHGAYMAALQGFFANVTTTEAFLDSVK